MELRRLCDELRRDDLLSNTREQNFNVIARNVCAQLKLDATSVAEKLAWPQHLIERWLLEPEHSAYKAMTPRDFEHFSFALDSITTNTLCNINVVKCYPLQQSTTVSEIRELLAFTLSRDGYDVSKQIRQKPHYSGWKASYLI